MNIKDIIKKNLPQSVVNKIQLTLNDRMPFNQSIKKREDEVKKIYKKYIGENLDLSNVKTFNEKIQWLKLYYDHEDLPKVVCKYNFKKYIKENLGDGYTVPMYAVWDDVRKINFDNLPDKFVLKSNCSSAGNFIKIIEDKTKLDMHQLKEELREWLNPRNLMINSYCRAYWKVKPYIIAEKYVEQIDGQAYDYKFFCFGGEPKFAYVATDHFPGEISKISVYDLDWNILDVKYGNHPQNNVKQPESLPAMIEIARKLSKKFPFVRVDFFELDGKPVLSELTFYPGGGLNKIYPEKVDEEWGSYIDLPSKKNIYKPRRSILRTLKSIVR